LKSSVLSGPIVSNSGPLITLAKINQIHLLYPLYGTVLILSAVYEEAAVEGLARGEADALSIEMAYINGHLQVIELTESQLLSRVSLLSLDWGEKYAIQLAINEKAQLLLLDDLQARNEAKKFGLSLLRVKSVQKKQKFSTRRKRR
jgi:predicted nucleic acid-binding protein